MTIKKNVIQKLLAIELAVNKMESTYDRLRSHQLVAIANKNLFEALSTHLNMSRF